ncbi:MAG: nucleotidyltransferase domain-containing protein [Bacteroidetes bacterium]|nr:nucleotidyltransferase domain-containing protein [Bacteroidota bacterium]MBU2507391.1 nucleotidyltransferase domain-containing protein [Bacteroidota bacterium]
MAVRSIEQIKNTVQEYALLLHSVGMPIEKIILFGSYSKGKQTENSDIDLAVILKKFSDDKFSTRLKLLKYCRNY